MNKYKIKYTKQNDKYYKLTINNVDIYGIDEIIILAIKELQKQNKKMQKDIEDILKICQENGIYLCAIEK